MIAILPQGASPHLAPRIAKPGRTGLAAGLVFLVAGKSQRELVVGTAPTVVTASAPFVFSPYGAGLPYREYPSAVGVGNWDFTSGAFSVASLLYLDATPNLSNGSSFISRINYVNESNNQGWGLTYRQPSDRNRFEFAVQRNNSTVTNAPVSCGALQTGLVLLVGTSNGTTTKSGYKNGVLQSSVGNNLNPLAATANLATGQGGAFLGGGMQVFWSAGWNRELSSAEVAELWANPWKLFAEITPSPPPGLISTAAAGGTGARSMIVVAG